MTLTFAKDGAVMKPDGNLDRQGTGRWMNNRAENSHPPAWRCERVMFRFRSMRILQTFNTVHSAVFSHFHGERSLSTRAILKLNRAAALARRRGLCAA
jgi:putative transposase